MVNRKKIESRKKGEEIEEKIPSYSVIRQWLGKIELYELQRQKEKRNDWISIIDLTIELGTEKCLVILGIAGKVIKEKRLGVKWMFRT